jgi:hypothetical protein
VDAVSAEDAGVYKPHPGIYEELLRATKRPSSEVLPVSSNPCELIGAGAVGMHMAWCRRDQTARFDPWGPQPDHDAIINRRSPEVQERPRAELPCEAPGCLSGVATSPAELGTTSQPARSAWRCARYQSMAGS